MLTCALLAAVASASEPFDHDYAAYAAVLDGVVGPEGVRYDQLVTRREALDDVVAGFASAPIASFTPPQQLAMWINAYNALTLQVVVHGWPIETIKALDEGEVWRRRSFVVAGRSVTLDGIEHQHIRVLGDARIHGALNCASRGCAPLSAKPYRAATLDADLDAAARAWVGSTAVSVSDGVAAYNKVFEWFAEDFRAPGVDGEPEPSALAGASQFVLLYASPELAKSIGTTGSAIWLPYDWSLNVVSP